ncbi:MAG: hypothetical protein LBF87_01410 [Treponema sp.]|jgi:hypothetical protein|nr:hypothetical protein [Treponema sp.]
MLNWLALVIGMNHDYLASVPENYRNDGDRPKERPAGKRKTLTEGKPSGKSPV